jgi:hypothetical protein
VAGADGRVRDVILDGELTWRGEDTIAYYVFDKCS